VRSDVENAVAATVTRNRHSASKVIIKLRKHGLEISRRRPILQFPNAGIDPFIVFAEKGKEPTNSYFSFCLCDAIHDGAAMVTILLDEILWCPFEVELIENSLDNQRVALCPHISKEFF